MDNELYPLSSPPFLPLFQESLVCHLSHQSPEDPVTTAKSISGRQLASPLKHHLCVCSLFPFLLTFSPFLPTAPCGPRIPRLPCGRQISTLYLATHTRIPCSNSEHYLSFFLHLSNLTEMVGSQKHTEIDSVLCLQYLLPLQVVPEAPLHPVINGERLRTVYNGYLIAHE